MQIHVDLSRVFLSTLCMLGNIHDFLPTDIFNIIFFKVLF